MNEEFRTLVIAESVYNWDLGNSQVQQSLYGDDFARVVVYQHGLYFKHGHPVKNSPMFRNFERALYGKPTVAEPESERLWSSVAFHEFVQSPMESIKRRPSASDWEKGARVLEGVLKLLQPRVCIVLGTDMGKIWPMHEFSRIETRSYSMINRAYPRVLTIEIGDVSSKLLMIRHPSKYFSWEKWHEEFLAKEIPEFIEYMKGS